MSSISKEGLGLFQSLAATILAAAVLSLCSGCHVHSAGRSDSDESISVRWVQNTTDSNKFEVLVAGLYPGELEGIKKADWTIEDWSGLFYIRPRMPDELRNANLPVMLGNYSVELDSLRFVPQFPLDRKLNYIATFHPLALPQSGRFNRSDITAVFQIPGSPEQPPTLVLQIYPTASLLPENLLKFYLHFSAPMSRGRSYEYLHLRNASGKNIELPFLEIGEELWDPTMTRLTVLIDPGRIKRGVKPLEEVGPALESGKDYTLIIDREWQDAAGNELKSGFQKRIHVSPPERNPIDPNQWKLTPPKAGTADPVLIRFPRPLDHALALRVIQVTDQVGNLVIGETRLTGEEKLWSFTPAKAWPEGAYQAVVQTTLEDLAGNNIGKAFEVDLFESVETRLPSRAVKLPFATR